MPSIGLMSKCGTLKSVCSCSDCYVTNRDCISRTHRIFPECIAHTFPKHLLAGGPLDDNLLPSLSVAEYKCPIIHVLLKIRRIVLRTYTNFFPMTSSKRKDDCVPDFCNTEQEQLVTFASNASKILCMLHLEVPVKSQFYTNAHLNECFGKLSAWTEGKMIKAFPESSDNVYFRDMLLLNCYYCTLFTASVVFYRRAKGSMHFTPSAVNIIKTFMGASDINLYEAMLRVNLCDDTSSKMQSEDERAYERQMQRAGSSHHHAVTVHAN